MRHTAAVLVAAALVLSACGDGSSSSQPSLDSPPGMPAFVCPDPKAKVEPTPGDTLPTGARAARICYSADMPVAWQAPADPLTRGVGRLVSLVNRRLASPQGDACNADAGPAYRIVLDYPDGARTINGETAGCREVRVGGTERLGGRRVWNSYFRLLARQREHARPRQVSSTPLLCPTGQDRVPFAPLAEVGTLTRARFCLSSKDQRGETMTRRDLRILRHDAATSAGRRQRSPLRPSRCSRTLRFGYEIVGVDRWGDTVDLHAYCQAYPFTVPGTFRTVDVRELPATRRMFERLARAAFR
jgi:hypothetical protein